MYGSPYINTIIIIQEYSSLPGAPVDDKDSIGQSPLFYAVSHCQADQLVKLLIQAGETSSVVFCLLHFEYSVC